MTDDLIYQAPLSMVFISLLVALPLAAFIGHQVGSRFYKQRLAGAEPSTFVPSTTLGLLALMLAFTFSMAVARFDHRQKLVLDEANAIGTAYLRADIVPEPYKTKFKENLKIYVGERLGFFDARNDEHQLREVSRKTTETQNLIWNDIVDLSTKDRSPMTALFITAMNSVIDVSSERTFAMENRVPELAYIVILAIALTGMASLGFIKGAQGRTARSSVLTLALLFAVVIVLIQDFDRPRRGLIQVSQKSLYDLQESLGHGH